MHKINCGLHGWSISNFLYPAMKGENTCAWFEYDGVEAKFNADFIVGTREEFLKYIKDNNVPMYRPIGDGDLYWVPFGLYRVCLGNNRFCAGEAQGFKSACTAGEDSFFPLAYVFTGEIEYSKLREFVGSNPYKTVCSQYDIKPPKYYERWEQKEDNMFTRGLVEV